MIAQHHRIRQRPKRHCVFNQTRHAVKVRDIAQRDHQMIVFELKLAGTETGADCYDLSFQIYVLDLPHDQVAARAKSAELAKRHWSSRSTRRSLPVASAGRPNSSRD